MTLALTSTTHTASAETVTNKELPCLTAGLSNELNSIMQSNEHIEYKTMYVSGDNVNVRRQPSKNSEVIKQVSFNEKVIIIENKLQRDIRKGIVILKQWCIEQYLKTENVKEYVSNMANIVDRYKNLNSGFNQIFKEILKIPEDKMNAILYDPSKIDEQIMKNIEYDGKELISNISLRTVNYYSNRDFYTKIKEDIRKSTIILNEYKNFINNHQF